MAEGTITTAAAVEKQQFENQSEGWVGAVTIDATGASKGVAVAPGGRIWLSHPEQVLTANAPADPQHNPFLSQTFIRIDHTTGERREVQVTPLKPVSDQRYVPASERFVPAEQPDALHTAQAAAAAREEEPVVVTSGGDPVGDAAQRVTEAGTDREVPEPPARAQEAAQAAQEERETGAAQEPTGDAPEGAFAPNEEAGTPEAPAGPPAPPAPWTPGSTGG